MAREMSVTEKYYWYDMCPSCKQGRLVFMMNTTSRSIYLHCGECEMGWGSPKDVENNSSGFLILREDYDARAATKEEIGEDGWAFCIQGYFSV